MKKKKVILLSLTILLILILSLVLVFNKNIFKKLRGDTSQAAYERAGFASYEVYKSVVDAYNEGKSESDQVSYDTKLEDDQLKSISSKTITLPESTKDKIINLKGIDKLGDDNTILGEAEKVIISGMTISYILTINIDTTTYEVHDNKLPYISFGTKSKDYVINTFDFYNNSGDFGLNLAANFNTVNIHDNPKSYYYGEEIYSSIYINEGNIINFNYYNNSASRHISGNDYNITAIKNINIENNEGLIEQLNLYNVDNMLINNSQIKYLYIIGGNLNTIDLSNNTKLEQLKINNTKLTKIDLPNNASVEYIDLSNNQLINIDFPNNTSVVWDINLLENNFGDNFKYIVKGKNYNIKDVINLPGNTKYSVGTDNKIKIENDILTGEREGTTSFSVHNSKLYGYYGSSIIFSVNIYDVTSDEYTIDKENKQIVYKKDFDIGKITLTDGYTASLNEDELTIKNGEDIVDIFKIVKEKEVTTTKKTDSKTTTNKNDTNDSKKVTTKNSIRKTTEKRVLYKDINIKGLDVSRKDLEKVKGYNRNIILKDNDITFKINGLDNIDIIEDINLSYEFLKIGEYSDKETIKEVKNGYILKFNEEKTLPYKVLTEIKYDRIKENIKDHEIKVYLYKDNKYYLISDGIDVYNNKISYYMYEKGLYIITNDSIKNTSNIKTTTSINKKKVINKKVNNNDSKTLNVLLFGIIFSVIIFIIILYMFYKKRKEEKYNA